MSELSSNWELIESADLTLAVPTTISDAIPTAKPHEPSFYVDGFPTRLAVISGKCAISTYVAQARGILRSERQLYVTGSGNSLHMACKLVQMLKREKACVVDKVLTGVSIQPDLSSEAANHKGIRWLESQPTITFTLSRGEFAEMLSGSQEKAVIGIFEQHDPTHSGYVSLDVVRSLKFEDTFYANQTQIEAAAEYLSTLQTDNENVNLPQFLRYAAMLIHPLLKADVVQKMLTEASRSELPPDAP